jgi:hypothetical protein
VHVGIYFSHWHEKPLKNCPDLKVVV